MLVFRGVISLTKKGLSRAHRIYGNGILIYIDPIKKKKKKNIHVVGKYTVQTPMDPDPWGPGGV